MLYPESKKILHAMKTETVSRGHPDQPGWASRALIKACTHIEDDHVFDDALQDLVRMGILSVKPSREYGELYASSMRGRHRFIAFMNTTLGTVLTSVVFPAVVALITVLLDRWLNP